MCISRKDGVPLKGLTAPALDVSCLTFLAATEYLTKATERAGDGSEVENYAALTGI